jgi:hypothetical protein
MIRVVIICEGRTEKDFVKKIIAPHLLGYGVSASSPILGEPGRKGGDVRNKRVIDDIVDHLETDRNAFCTTFFDFYGMKTDVLGRSEAGKKSDHKEKKQIVEDAIFKAIKEKVGDTTIRRFKPYIQMYEFEGLLFSNVEKMSSRLSDGDSKIKQEIQSELEKILKAKSPEEINDSKETAPSKSIKKMFYNYGKITDGIPLAEDIGLKEIREKCLLFDDWIKWLESLSQKE